MSVPSNLTGSSTVSGSINYFLQQYLVDISGAISVGTTGFINEDVVTSPASGYTVNGGDSSAFEEFTNTNSTGTVASGSVPSGQQTYTVNPAATYVAVQAPGNLTLTGAVSTTFALFGASSNVDYSVANGGPSSIFAAGGADSITLRDDGAAGDLLDDTVLSAGNSTINLYGEGDAVATTGNGDFVQVDQTNATVDATGSTTVGWFSANSGGTLDFINSSSDTAFIQAGVFANGATDKTQVTAFGGAGGGFFIGGQGGGTHPNILVGGAPGSVTVSASGVISQVSADSTAGAVTLVGAVNGDILDAQGAGENDFFAGSGSETLIAASTTGGNLFQLGLAYPGVGAPQSNGVVSTDGSGTQTFFLGNSAGATLYGSTALSAGNANVYNFVSGPIAAGSDVTAGGGTFTIYNFAPGTSSILLDDYTGAASSPASVSAIYQNPANANEAVIGLSDGTTIKLYGVQAADIGQATLPSGVVFIYDQG